MNAKQIGYGIFGGLAGGLVFGAMMGVMGMLPMVGKLVGQPSAATGFIVHMVISAFIGAGFALALGRLATGIASGIRYGLLYGAAWWVLGPLTFMPLFLGMGFGANLNFTAAVNMFPSLVGHLLYGAILGISYVSLQGCVASCGTACSPKVSTVRAN